MQTFWVRGYGRTSIEALVGKTGVNRGSLYGTYPDKRAIFIAGLGRYLDQVVAGNIQRLLAIEPAGEAVRQFFLNLIEAPVRQLKQGCLLTNSAAEFGTDDPEVAALIRTAYRRVELALTKRLMEAHAQGYLAKSANPKALARLLLTVLQGIRVMARVGTDRQVMRDAVTSALAPIGAKRRVKTSASRRVPSKQ